MWFILSRSLLLGGGVLYWFREIFPQKMSYLQSCVGCTCVLLSLIGKVFRQQQLLWAYCCCCAGRLLVLREGNVQRVFNRINKDECELLVQYWVCTLVPRSASVALSEQTVVSSARTGTTEGFRALNCTCFGTFQGSAGASELCRCPWRAHTGTTGSPPL